jgi:hypothetical protein
LSTKHILENLTEVQRGHVYNPLGDGSCLFEALSIFCDQPKMAKHALRADMVKYCQKHAEVLAEQNNEVLPFAVTIRSFDPGNSFRSNQKTFTLPQSSSFKERCTHWRRYMSIGTDMKERFPIYGNTEALVVLANVCNCRIFVLSQAMSKDVWCVTKYCPIKEDDKTVSVSLWLRNDHFVIPAVDLEPLFGSAVSITPEFEFKKKIGIKSLLFDHHRSNSF